MSGIIGACLRPWDKNFLQIIAVVSNQRHLPRYPVQVGPLSHESFSVPLPYSYVSDVNIIQGQIQILCQGKVIWFRVSAFYWSSWHTILHWFQAYNIVIWQRCKLYCAHHNCSYHLSPNNASTILSTVFPLLYLLSLWLIHPIYESLYLPLPFT